MLTTDRRNALLLFLILLLGLGLRLYHLNFSSLWGDEAFSRFYAESPLNYLWSTGMHLETNPPGYYTFLHFWMQVFGTSEFSLRLPSALTSVLTIILVYALGRELEGPRLGILAAFLLAVAPTEIWYAQEARNYAMEHTAIALLLLGVARFLHQPDSQAGLFFYLIGGAASVYFHDTALLIIVACQLALLAAWWQKRLHPSLPSLRAWIMTNALLVVLILPQVLAMCSQSGSHNLHWIPPFTFSTACAQLSETMRGPAAVIEGRGGYGLLFLASLGLALLVVRPRDYRFRIVLLLIPFLFVSLMALASLKQSIFIVRALSWLWVPLSLVLASVLLSKTFPRWILLGLTLLLFGNGLHAQLFPRHCLTQDWRQLLRDYRERALQQRSDLILIDNRDSRLMAFAYYFPEAMPQLKFWHSDPDWPIDFSTRFITEKYNLSRIETAQLPDLIASGHPLTIILKESDKNRLTLLPPPLHTLQNTRGAYVMHWGSSWYYKTRAD